MFKYIFFLEWRKYSVIRRQVQRKSQQKYLKGILNSTSVTFE